MKPIRFLVNWTVILTMPLWGWALLWWLMIKDREYSGAKKIFSGESWILSDV